MIRPSARLIAAALMMTCGWLGSLPRAALAQPGLTHLTPGAITPGKTTEITLHGTKLDGALRVWTSFPAQVEVAAAESKQKNRTQAVCKVALGTGAPIGIGGIAVTTADGVSDVVYLMIDDLPTIADGGKNHETATAQDISLPTAIDGQCDGTLADYYRFAAKAGERISCEVVATRLGWDFDPLVRLLDASGNELLLADDDAATGADTRFVFTSPANGQYLLELRDNRYKPGGRYRLRLGDFTLVSTTLPLLAQRGTPTDISFRGPLVDSVPALTILPLGNESGADAFGLTARSASRQSSGWATLGVTDLPVCAEATRPANSKDATRINIPCIVSGTLELPRERDLFGFEAAKGQQLRFRAITRSNGSPAILSLRLLDSAGKQIAESPVTDSDEPVLNFTPPADGTYTIAIEELAGRGGSDFVYAVECKPGQHFALLLKNDKNNRLRYSLPAGGAFYLDVQCQRTGYDGPITLALDAHRTGWQVFNNVIAAKANEVRMYVQPPLDWSAGELAELQVVGRAQSSGREITVAMSTTVQLRLARPQMPYPPRWHDGAIFVSGQGVKPGFFT
ncbi:MAG TPA: pre-peptidase C-terminal domain-containing protein, partial [Pirellulaceae bacterium]|nr:pre-peptidase C-terminal domain-containing protein [Pirellulaceae bacterium]